MGELDEVCVIPDCMGCFQDEGFGPAVLFEVIFQLVQLLAVEQSSLEIMLEVVLLETVQVLFMMMIVMDCVEMVVVVADKWLYPFDFMIFKP